jgi:hypothetical protein
MDSESKRREAEETGRESKDILRRVDALPVKDPRTWDEILGYDENGLPQLQESCASETPVFRPYRIPKAVQEFLKYRHREWELGMEADLKARQEARAERTRKP